jgi:hypothetical protein
MLDRKLSSWFYPKPTDDPGRDRNARTLQFACFLFAFAVGTVAIVNVIAHEPSANAGTGFRCGGLGFRWRYESFGEMGGGGADCLSGRAVDRNPASSRSPRRIP